MHKRGFTLVELLVVIAIIGVLASIVMISTTGAKSRSRDSKRQADIKSIQLALSLYYSDNGMYPTNIYATTGSAPASGLAPSYLPVVPIDPSAAAGTSCTNSGVAGCYKYVAYTTGTGGSSICNSTSLPPITYHLGAAIENPSDSLQDVDADNGGTVVYTANNKCSATGANTFNGNAAGCAPTTPASVPDACFDVSP